MTEQEQLKKIEQLNPEVEAKNLDNVINLIYRIQRAKQGLPEEEDPTNGFIKVDDIRQTTILPDEADVLFHVYMETMFKLGGDEWGIMDIMAESEKAHRKSERGQNFGYFVLMQNAKTNVDAASLNITLPSPSPTEASQQTQHSVAPKKKGFISRILHR